MPGNQQASLDLKANKDQSGKTFVQRSMYKRELCKNWAESGFCRFGEKCQYAHGVDELSEEHHLYLMEQMKQPNDKYKSQNCRAFYREKICMYGKRCHFRHEFRSFKKIHRHFYMCHLSALSYTHNDMLSQSKQSADGELEQIEKETKIAKTDSFNENSTSDESCDSSFDLDGVLKETFNSDSNDQESDCMQMMGQRPRIRAFS